MPKPTPPRAPEALQTIDPTALTAVSGGTSRAATAAASGGGDADASVLAALGGILDSLTSLAGQNRGGGGFNAQEMMLFMMMMQQRNSQVMVQPAASLPVVYTNGTNRVF